jgi:hypothetical protein
MTASRQLQPAANPILRTVMSLKRAGSSSFAIGGWPWVLAALAVALPGAGEAQGAAWQCGPFGDARSADAIALDSLKNRTRSPDSSEVDPSATLAAIVAPGDDRTRWNEHRGAVVVGYVLHVMPGGVESANCHARSLLHRDTHIELVVDPADSAGPKRVIVEVTPRVRALMAARGVDWSTATLQRDFIRHWVKVTGWLMFDTDHIAQSENTAPKRPNDWRATAWEVHPVTGLEVVPRPQ